MYNQKLFTCRVHDQNILEISTKLTGSDIKNINKYMTEQKKKKKYTEEAIYKRHSNCQQIKEKMPSIAKTKNIQIQARYHFVH